MFERSLGKSYIYIVALLSILFALLLTPRLCSASTIELPSNANVLGTLSSDNGDVTGISLLSTTSVTYLDENGNTKTVSNATIIDSSYTNTEWTSGYYVVQGNVTFSERITVDSVILILADNCTLNANAGITVSSGSDLTIYAQSTDEDTMGKLVATATTSGYAGIGGTSSGSNGEIVINGGIITATGGSYGAGIGSGRGTSSSHATASDITISGGTITATGGGNGAGIGGGQYGDASNITITGGTVTARGGIQAAGIGGGYSGDADNITITGGTVNATGGSRGAGIGGGSYGSDASYITISGGTVTATASSYAAGIGGGYHGDASYITITGGIVTATANGTYSGAGIGGGYYLTKATNITISGGTVTATSVNGEAVGCGYGGTGCTDIKINYTQGYYYYKTSENDNWTYTTSELVQEYYTGTYLQLLEDHFKVTTSDGTYTYEDQTITITSSGTYTITGDGEDEDAHSGYQIYINGNLSVDLTINNVKMSNSSTTPFYIAGSSSVVLNLEGDNVFTSNRNGYGGIDYSNSTNTSGLTITSDSNENTLTATGGEEAAGIGSGWGVSASNITISGGTITATGGSYGGAGIGGGFWGTGSEIKITGGVVTATGGDGDYGGAGIGGGFVGSASNITITGGTVIATGGENGGAGIGGGGGVGSASNIVITGGTVTATSVNGEAVGCGYNGADCTNININYTQGYYYYKTSEDGSWTYKTSALEERYYTGTYLQLAENVSKESNSATVSIAGWNVGESPNTPTVSATYGADEATYTYSNSETGTYSSTVPTTAGTWYVKATIAEGDTYEGTEAITSFTIGKGTPTVTFTTTPSLSKTYDGNAVSLGTSTVSVTGGTVGNVSITGNVSIVYYSKSGSNYTRLNSAPSAVGSYAVRAYVASDDNWNEAYSSYVDFTISQATPSASNFSVTLPTELIYDNTVKTATAATSATGMGEFIIKYSTDNSTWSTSAPKDVGTYYVMVSVSAGSNYTAYDVTDSNWTFTITQATNSWVTTPSIAGWVYGGTASTPAGSATWGEVEFTYSDNRNGSYTAEQPTSAGTYYMKASVEGTSNYTGLESDPIEFVISKASSSIAFKSGFSLDKTYDGSSVSVTVSNVETTGSTGTISFVYYEQVDGSSWEELGSTAPSDAGTYKVVAKLAADTNYSAAESSELTFTISKATNVWTSTLSIRDWTYGDEPNSAIAVAKFGTEDIVYTYSSSASGTFTEDVPTDAGTYYVKATISGTANYTALVSDAVKFTISKADSTITITTASLDKTYDGVAVSDPETTTTGSSGEVSFTYYELTDESSNTWEGIGSAPVNAGSYKVVATVASDNNYNEATSTELTFTISKATPAAGNFTVSLPTELVYDDTAKTATATTSATDIGDFVIKYSTDNSTWSTSAPKDVGTYYVMVSVTAGGNYTACDVTDSDWTFTITQATNSWTIIPGIAGWVYGETASTPAGSATWGEVEFTYSNSRTGSYTTEQPTTVGTYYMKATVEGTANYTGLESDPIEFVISQASSSISFKSGFSLDKTYDGAPVTVTTDNVEITGSGGEISFVYYEQVDEYMWDELGSTAPSDVGTYKVVAKLAADTSYNAAESDELTFTISKATNVWTTTLVIRDWTYGDEPNTPIAVAKFGTEDIIYTYSSSASGTFTEEVPSDAGTYYVKATINGTANYTALVSDAVKFTISKADSTITITTASLDKTYDGNAVSDPETTTTGSSGSVSFTYYELTDESSNTWEGIGSAPVNAGSYKVIATVASDNNYNEATSTELQFTISQATNEWVGTLEITGWTYGGTANQPSASAKFGDAVFTYSDNLDGEYTEDVPTEAGTYYVKATVEGTSDYTGLESTAVEFTISKATLTADNFTFTGPSGTTYDGDGKAASVTSAEGVNGVGDVTIYYSTDRENWSTTPPTTTGTYYVAISVGAGDNYKETGENEYLTSEDWMFTISRAENTWEEELTITGWTYGEYDAGVNTPIAVASFGEAKFVYSASEDGEYTEDVPTEAGTYYVKAMVEGTSDYTSLESTAVEFTVSKATLTADNFTFTEPSDTVYDGNEKVANVTSNVSGAGVVTVYYTTDGLTWSTSVPTDAGVYTVGISVVEGDNYNGTPAETYLTSDAWVFTITQATNEWLETLEITGWVYGETANQPSASAKFGKVIFTYSASEDGEYTSTVPTEAGTYYVKATVEETSNYTGLESNAVKFIISRSSSSITIADESAFRDALGKTYDGQPVSTDGLDEYISATGSSNDVVYVWEYKDGDGEWHTMDSVPVDAGEYRVTVTVEADTNYSAASSDPIEFTIEKSTDTTITFDESEISDALSKEYDGEPVSTDGLDIEVSGSTSTPTFKWEYKDSDGNWVETNDVPTDAGDYRVTIIVPGDDNYEETSVGPIEFTIGKSTGTTITAGEDEISDGLSKEYDGNPVNTDDLGIKVDGSSSTPTFKWEYWDGENWIETDDVPTDAGSYRVTIIIPGDDNYDEISVGPIEFTIDKSTGTTITVDEDEISDALSKEYDGDPVNTDGLDIKVEGSTSTPTFKWEYKDSDGNWVETTDVPTSAGDYRVTIVVPADDNYEESSVGPIEFTIGKSSGTTIAIDENEISDALSKEYDGTPVDIDDLGIEVDGSSSDPTFKWEYWDGEQWIVIDDAPTDPGTYRVTIIVPGDDNYEETSFGPIEFTITGGTDDTDNNISTEENGTNTTVENGVSNSSDNEGGNETETTEGNVSEITEGEENSSADEENDNNSTSTVEGWMSQTGDQILLTVGSIFIMLLTIASIVARYISKRRSSE